MKKILMTLVTLFSLTAFAHEGHDHGTGQVQPIKGGVIMKTDHFYLEAVGSQSEIKFYPLVQENEKSLLKPMPLKDIKITATYKLPRGKEVQKIALKENGDHFIGSVKAKTHRYQVDANIEYKNEKEHFTYQIEPQE